MSQFLKNSKKWQNIGNKNNNKKTVRWINLKINRNLKMKIFS